MRTAPAENTRKGGLLSGWKAISTYLDRSVRTAQRWAQVCSLPIHGIAIGRGRAVYAYRQELDEWLATRASETSAVNVRGDVPVSTALVAMSYAAMALLTMRGGGVTGARANADDLLHQETVRFKGGEIEVVVRMSFGGTRKGHGSKG